MGKPVKPNIETMPLPVQVAALLQYIEELRKQFEFELDHIGAKNINDREIDKIKEKLGI